MLIFLNKKEQNTASVDVHHREALSIVGGNVIAPATMENIMQGPPNIKNRTIVLPSSSASGNICRKTKKKETQAQEGICTLMFIGVCFTIAKICSTLSVHCWVSGERW